MHETFLDRPVDSIGQKAVLRLTECKLVRGCAIMRAHATRTYILGAWHEESASSVCRPGTRVYIRPSSNNRRGSSLLDGPYIFCEGDVSTDALCVEHATGIA